MSSGQKNLADPATAALRQERREAAAWRRKLGEQLLKTQNQLFAIRDVRYKLSRDAKKKSVGVGLNTEQLSGPALRAHSARLGPSYADPNPNHKAVSLELLKKSQQLRFQNQNMLREAEQSQAETKAAADRALKESARQYKYMQGEIALSKGKTRVAWNASERQKWLSSTANQIHLGPESSRDLKTFERRDRPLVKVHDRAFGHKPGKISRAENGKAGTKQFEEAIKTTGSLAQDFKSTTMDLLAFEHDYKTTGEIDREILRMRNRNRRTQWKK